MGLTAALMLAAAVSSASANRLEVNEDGLNNTNGRANVLTDDLPLHAQYDSFRGELPEIAGVAVRLIGARFAVDATGALPACLAGTDTTDPGIGIFSLDDSNRATGFRMDDPR